MMEMLLFREVGTKRKPCSAIQSKIALPTTFVIMIIMCCTQHYQTLCSISSQVVVFRLDGDSDSFRQTLLYD